MNRRLQPSTFNLHPSLPDWRLYAAAGAAAIAATSAADASIIYVDPSVKPDAKLPGAGPFAAADVQATFNIDGVSASVDIQRRAVDANTNFSDAYGKVGAGLICNKSIYGSTRTAHHFNANANIAIGGTGGLIGRGALASGYSRFTYGHPLLGNKSFGFNNSKSGFAGFQLPASKGGGFGWIRFDVIDRNGDGLPDEVEAVDWAYNDAGGGITAGQGIGSQVPEPGSKALALLALGSAGVLAWRRGKRMKVEG